MQRLSSLENVLRVSGLLCFPLMASTVVCIPSVHAADAQTFRQVYIEAAQAYSDADYAKARVKWESALKLATTNSEKVLVKTYLGTTLNLLGEFKEARVQLEEALLLAKSPPGKIDIQTDLYQSLIGLKELDQAQTVLDDLQAAPDDVLPKMQKQLLATLLLQAQGKRKEAADATEKIMWENREKFPNQKFTPDGKFARPSVDDINRIRYGPILGDVTGKTPDEIEDALEKVAQDPNAPASKREPAKIFVGDFLMQHNKTFLARDFYLDANVKFLGFGAEIRRLTKIGDTYVAQKNWAKARDYYDMALKAPGATSLDSAQAKAKRDSVARFLK